MDIADLTKDPSAKMRFAMLHIANAIAKDSIASNLHPLRKRAHQLERNEELLKAIALCQGSMVITAKRSYRRRKPLPSPKQPERRPAP